MAERSKPVIEVIDDDMAAVLRRKTPAERLRSAHAMWQYARRRLSNMLRRQHPEWDEQQLKAEIRRRVLGPEAGTD
jgi:hypothetical protein